MAGSEQLPWKWAVERLEAERNYWLCTVRRDGFPQARPVWGTWSDVGLLLSVGHGGLQRAATAPAMPITVHTDDAMDPVIIEGVVDRIAASRRAPDRFAATFSVDDGLLREAVARYNAKYNWNFEPDGGDLNFLVRPIVVYGWHSTPTAVEGGTKWTFPDPRA